VLSRILTGLVLAPLAVLALLFLPDTAGVGLAMIAGAITLDEFDRIVRPGRRRDAVWAAQMACLLALFAAALRPGGTALLGAGLFLSTVLQAVLRLLRPEPLETALRDIAGPVLGTVWVGLPLGLVTAALTGPLGGDAGNHVILALLAMVFAGDTCAYFTGMAFGRHRLYPAVSPKKTVEGALGGLAGSVAGGLVIKGLLGLSPGWLAVALLGLAAGVAEQAGDLCQSMLKRGAGIKDSGSLLPGHGGMFDRLDGLLFAAPVVYYGWIIASSPG